MKPRLVSSKPLTLHSNWLVPIVSEYFDLLVSDSADVMQPHDCYYTSDWDDCTKQLARDGYKIVIDRLWEAAFRPKDPYPCYVLQNYNWFWYQESLWYRYLGYHTHQSNPQWTYHALMPMRRQKKSRDFIIELLESNLHRFLWSYQEKARHLPDGGNYEDWDSQRLYRDSWYNTTAMSLVMETAADSNGNTVPFITEKTFKPMAFFHPFVVCGDWQTLDYLHTLGFETFDNLFDETYDSIKPWQQRCRFAVEQCLTFDSETNSYDYLTKQKLQHNHQHFFDQSLVIDKITKEVLEPLRHYAET